MHRRPAEHSEARAKVARALSYADESIYLARVDLLPCDDGRWLVSSSSLLAASARRAAEGGTAAAPKRWRRRCCAD